jgi:hypothetical protein
MKRILGIACLALFLGAWGCGQRAPDSRKLEEHVKGSSDVSEDAGPRLTEAGGGQGSGATGTNGTGVSGANPEGAGDPDSASGGDSSN